MSLRSLLLVGLAVALSIAVVRLSVAAIANNQSQPIAGCPASSGSTGEIDPTQTIAFWQNQPITPLTALNTTAPEPQQNVLGVNDNKWIEIDLSDQKLIAHDGGSIFLETLVSTGLPGTPTPKGEYRIWYKITATKMEGGSRARGNYYYLPNVPYAMFFYKGYGVHGTYWHKNFGRRMSHGCVNSPTPIAEKLFYWAEPQLPPGKHSIRSTAENPGTRVVVHD